MYQIAEASIQGYYAGLESCSRTVVFGGQHYLAQILTEVTKCPTGDTTTIALEPLEDSVYPPQFATIDMAGALITLRSYMFADPLNEPLPLCLGTRVRIAVADKDTWDPKLREAIKGKIGHVSRIVPSVLTRSVSYLVRTPVAPSRSLLLKREDLIERSELGSLVLNCQTATYCVFSLNNEGSETAFILKGKHAPASAVAYVKQLGYEMPSPPYLCKSAPSRPLEPYVHCIDVPLTSAQAVDVLHHTRFLF